MVLKAFWGSLGLLLGALGALLGVSWELLRASGSTKEGLQIRLGTLLGLVCSLLAAENGLGRVLGPSLARFWCPRGPFGGVFCVFQLIEPGRWFPTAHLSLLCQVMMKMKMLPIKRGSERPLANQQATRVADYAF